MLFSFSTPVLIRHMWQVKRAVFMHWCLMCILLLLNKKHHAAFVVVAFCRCEGRQEKLYAIKQPSLVQTLRKLQLNPPFILNLFNLFSRYVASSCNGHINSSVSRNIITEFVNNFYPKCQLYYVFITQPSNQLI